jgi:hypothetical protein
MNGCDLDNDNGGDLYSKINNMFYKTNLSFHNTIDIALCKVATTTTVLLLVS